MMRAGAARRLWVEESGSELVEFAMTSSLLLLVIFGIMDCSRALYTYHYVAQAARLGTRYASVRGVSATGLLCGISPFQCVATASDVSNYVKSMSPLGLSASGLTIATTWPGTTPVGTVCNLLAINNSPGCTVNVKVSYTFSFILPFLPRSALPMTSTSKMVIAQ